MLLSCSLWNWCSVLFCFLLLLYRHYRDRSDETPSHTGGVSDAYIQKVKDKRDWDRGVYASSSKDRDRNKTTEDGTKLHIHCIAICPSDEYTCIYNFFYFCLLANVLLVKPVICIIIYQTEHTHWTFGVDCHCKYETLFVFCCMYKIDHNRIEFYLTCSTVVTHDHGCSQRRS